MKTNIRIKPLCLGVALVGMILSIGATASAATFYNATNQSTAGTDWTQAIWTNATQTTPVVATSGNEYWVTTFAGIPAAVRSINTTNAQSFAGDNLVLTNGGVWWMKNAGGPCNVNVVLDGGQIQFHGSGSDPAYFGGKLQVNFNTNTTVGASGSIGAGWYNLGSDQGAATDKKNIFLGANISGNGNLVVNMGLVETGSRNTIFLAGTNTDFHGNWTNNQGFLHIVSSSVNPLGSGAVVMNVSAASAALIVDSTNALVITNSIRGNGAIIKSNINIVTLNGDLSSFIGRTIVPAGVLQIGANSAISNSAVISLQGGTLDASLLGGLDMGSSANNQMMTNCNGTVISNLTVATGNALNFNLTPTTNDILNVTGSLILNGNPTLSLTLSGFKPAGTYRLINYNTNSNIQGGGSFTLVTPPGSGQGFSLNTSTNGQVNLVVTGVPKNITWNGDDAANNWDTVTLNWNGNTTNFSTGDNVTFNDAGSAVPNINLVGTIAAGSITVSNTTKHYIFGFSSGNIVSSSGLTKLGTNELDLVTLGNSFTGPVDIRSGILSIGVGGDGSLGATSSITNNGILRVNVDGVAVAFNSLISGSGALEITGAGSGATATIGGNGHNTYTGLTTIGNLCQLNIATSNALGSAGTGTIVQSGGRLGVTSVVGNMRFDEPVTINGNGITAFPGALYVTDPANIVTWAGPITVASSSLIRGVNNSRMNLSNTVLGTNVALQCVVGNPATPTETSTIIFFQNTLSLGSSGSLTVDGIGTVVLEGGTNVWGGGTTVTRGTLRVSGKLDGGTVTVNTGTNNATLGGLGTILGSVTVLTNGTLAPGNFSAIGTLTVSNSVTLNAGSTTVMQLDRTGSPNADKLAANSISFGGTLTVTNVGAALVANDTFDLFNGTASGTFAITNLPTLSSPLSWDTSLLQSQGIIKVASTVPPTPTNYVARIIGTNFVFETAPAGVGFNYVLQSTPALNPPPVVWTSRKTNAGNGGTLSFTNPITPGTPKEFFRIQAQ